MYTWRGIFHLVVVYIVWGSTYLAIRVAVREGAGFPPFTMASMRTLVACLILFSWARLARAKVRLQRRELLILIVVSILLWVGGNGLVTVAEKRAHSGYAALLVASMPLWVAFMEAGIDRRRPSLRLLGALLIGLGGVAVLNLPVIRAGERADVYAAILLLSAAVLWGLGSIIQRRNPVMISPEASSAYQQCFGGIALFIAARLGGEAAPAPIPQAWLAWAYLVIFGSVFAFTSFVKALRLLPTTVVMTYAYVNPVIAVLLGWLLLAEPVTPWTIAGSILIVLGVAGVFHEKARQREQGVKIDSGGRGGAASVEG